MNRRAPFLDHEGSDSSQFLGTCCPGGPSSPRPIPRSSLVLAVPGDPPPLVRFLPVPWYLLDGGACRRTQNVGVHCILRVMQCVHSMQRLFNANLPRVMPLPCRRPPRGSRRATQSSPRRPPRRWSRTRRSAHQAKHTRLHAMLTRYCCCWERPLPLSHCTTNWQRPDRENMNNASQ